MSISLKNWMKSYVFDSDQWKVLFDLQNIINEKVYAIFLFPIRTHFATIGTKLC